MRALKQNTYWSLVFPVPWKYIKRACFATVLLTHTLLRWASPLLPELPQVDWRCRYSICHPGLKLSCMPHWKESCVFWCWDTMHPSPVMDPQPTCIVLADWSAPWECCLSLIMLSSVDRGPESHGSRPSQKFLALVGRSCGLFLSGRGNHWEFPTTLPITSKQMDGGHRWVLHAGNALQVLWE